MVGLDGLLHLLQSILLILAAAVWGKSSLGHAYAHGTACGVEAYADGPEAHQHASDDIDDADGKRSITLLPPLCHVQH